MGDGVCLCAWSGGGGWGVGRLHQSSSQETTPLPPVKPFVNLSMQTDRLQQIVRTEIIHCKM